MAERRSLLLAMLEAVYVDHDDAKAVVAIQPKPAFRAVFQVATTRADSGVTLIKEPPERDEEAPSPCSWWRRGREPVSERGNSQVQKRVKLMARPDVGGSPMPLKEEDQIHD